MSSFWKALCCCCCRKVDYESVRGSSSSSGSEFQSSASREERHRRRQRLIKAYSGEEVVQRQHPRRIGMQSGEDSDTLYEVAGPAEPADIKIVNPAFHPHKDTGTV